jgi:uncharacterized membrane protein YphA (DoxX/SURF4 family)
MARSLAWARDGWSALGRRLADARGCRFVFLRGLGLVYVSVFVSLVGTIHGLIGPRGVLPAAEYLQALRAGLTLPARLWLAPTLLWLSASDGALTALVIVGMVASVALTLGLWPRASIFVAALAFLSFIAAAQDFAAYQSDGMLLEASALSLLLAPRGFVDRLRGGPPPSRAALFLLRWEWFRIYFESGVGKLVSGDPQWRSLTAMIKYYENGPLPTWIAWYAQQRLPRGFHVGSALATLALELVVPWAMFAGRRLRRAAFVLVTTFQIGIILTANYAFLNYLVALLGFLLVCDMPEKLDIPRWKQNVNRAFAALFMYATVTAYVDAGVLAWPARLLSPLRIANRYGLFASMTDARYELEFQGTIDGREWIAYPFRFKPQDIDKPPGIYAPYQPRFDWDLWFATLGGVDDYPWVVTVEERLLAGEPSVLRLFARDPFAGRKPIAVRTVRWQYWFTTPAEKRATGNWWRRERLDLYAPVMPVRDMPSP